MDENVKEIKEAFENHDPTFPYSAKWKWISYLLTLLSEKETEIERLKAEKDVLICDVEILKIALEKTYDDEKRNRLTKDNEFLEARVKELKEGIRKAINLLAIKKGNLIINRNLIETTLKKLIESERRDAL